MTKSSSEIDKAMSAAPMMVGPDDRQGYGHEGPAGTHPDPGRCPPPPSRRSQAAKNNQDDEGLRDHQMPQYPVGRPSGKVDQAHEAAHHRNADDQGRRSIMGMLMIPIKISARRDAMRASTRAAMVPIATDRITAKIATIRLFHIAGQNSASANSLRYQSR
jgi:hypothetical protein